MCSAGNMEKDNMPRWPSGYGASLESLWGSAPHEFKSRPRRNDFNSPESLVKPIFVLEIIVIKEFGKFLRDYKKADLNYFS